MDDSIVLHSSAASAVVERVQRCFSARDRYAVNCVGNDVVQLVGAVRGLRRSRGLCTVRVVVEPQQLIVLVTGELANDADLGALRAAVRGDPSDDLAFVPVASFRPAGAAAGGRFVPPDDWFVAPAAPDADDGPTWDPPSGLPHELDVPSTSRAGEMTVVRGRQRDAAVPDSPAGTVIMLAVGRRLLEVGDGCTVLIGRDPRPRPGDGNGVELCIVEDPLMSRTHLAVGVSHGSAWVEDRGSANGTELHVEGEVVHLRPDTRTVPSLPSRVVAGDTTVTVSAKAAP